MVKTIWKDLPQWAKGTLVVVGLLAVVGVSYGIYKGVKKVVDKAKTNKEGQESKDELQKAEAEGIKATISAAEAEAKVSALLSAARGCDPLGSGASSIISVIKSLKNKSDYYLLSTTFGTRSWDECSWTGDFVGDVTGSLTTLLTEELDSGQMDEVRKHLSTIGVNI